MTGKQGGPAALPCVSFTFNGSMTPADFVVHLHEAVAILRAKRDAVQSGLLQLGETLHYEWSAEALSTGDEPWRLRVRAHLRDMRTGRPRMLHLESSSLAMIADGQGTPCLYCGRPARRGLQATHLAPSGTRGPSGCRAASRLWPDGEDDEVPARYQADCAVAPDFRP